MKSETETLSQNPEDVLNDLRALVSEAEKMLGHTGGVNYSGTVAALRERFEAAQERLSTFYAGARQKVINGAKATDTTIRSHPYESMAIALGVGLLAGVLLGRRSK